MQGALGSRYIPYGPAMNNDAEPVGTHEPELALIPADSALDVTLVSAGLIPLPGFRVPRLLSTGGGGQHLPWTGHCVSVSKRQIDIRDRRWS
jgi:hypothetical protein